MMVLSWLSSVNDRIEVEGVTGLPATGLSKILLVRWQKKMFEIPTCMGAKLMSEKENRQIACGAPNVLRRHHVMAALPQVPHC